MTAKPSKRASDGPLRGTYQLLRRQFRRRCIAARAPCHLCGEPIDWSLRHPDPGSFEVNHDPPVALRPDLEMAVEVSWHPSHRLCNQLNMAAYDRDAVGGGEVPDTGWPSACWVCVGECSCGFVDRARA